MIVSLLATEPGEEALYRQRLPPSRPSPSGLTPNYTSPFGNSRSYTTHPGLPGNRTHMEEFPREPVQLRFEENLEEVGPDCEALVVPLGMNVGESALQSHPSLRMVLTRSHSLDHIDVQACNARGVQVLSLPAYGENAVAEHTFALMLALSRRLRETWDDSRRGHFSYQSSRGFELHGNTLGIIGLGRIGKRVAAIARGFGMEILATDPKEDQESANALGVRYCGLQTLLAQSRVVTLHANLTSETYHMINSRTLALCRPRVLLINTARGALIELQALRQGLQSGHIGGAGLDVLEDERVLRDTATRILSAEIVSRLRSEALAPHPRDTERLLKLQQLVLCDAVLSRPNVVFTPHVAFNSEESAERIRALTVNRLLEFLL
jgi:D-lactate dehydrogenase